MASSNQPMKLHVTSLLLLPAVLPALRVPPSSQARLTRRSLCAAALIAPPTAARAAIDLSAFLDEADEERVATRRYERMRGMGDSSAKADALRAQTAAEEATKAARAEKAIARAKETAAAKEREREAIKASGVPPCDNSGPWGSATGLLTAKTCSRVRDGTIEQRERSGFFLIG